MITCTTGKDPNTKRKTKRGLVNQLLLPHGDFPPVPASAISPEAVSHPKSTRRNTNSMHEPKRTGKSSHPTSLLHVDSGTVRQPSNCPDSCAAQALLLSAGIMIEAREDDSGLEGQSPRSNEERNEQGNGRPLILAVSPHHQRFLYPRGQEKNQIAIES